MSVDIYRELDIAKYCQTPTETKMAEEFHTLTSRLKIEKPEVEFIELPRNKWCGRVEFLGRNFKANGNGKKFFEGELFEQMTSLLHELGMYKNFSPVSHKS